MKPHALNRLVQKGLCGFRIPPDGQAKVDHLPIRIDGAPQVTPLPFDADISASGLTRRMTQSDLIAQAVELDMVEAGWQPTADTYLNRVPKARILEAVREAKVSDVSACGTDLRFS